MKSSTSYQLARLISVTSIVPALAAILIIAVPLATGEETEVFNSTPNEVTRPASGFDKDSVLRVEPAKDQPLVLHLRDLPDHQFLKVDAVIDMNEVGGTSAGIIRVFGGAGRAVPGAKDLRGRFQVTVDGKDAVHASFGGQMGNAAGGSFPDLHGHFLHLPGTGSAKGPIDMKAGKAGAVRVAGLGKDADKLREHRVRFVIPHTGDEAEIEFRWIKPGGAKAGAAVIRIAGIGNAPSAPFSVKNLTASVVETPRKLSAAEFSQRYEALGSENPVEAMAALNDLIAAGPGVLPMLRAELHKKGDPDIEKKFAEALEAMDDPSFEVRAGAAKALGELGKDVVPLARRALAEQEDELSIEVRNNLKNLAERIEKGTTATAEASRTNRLHRLLDTLGGEEAEKLKASLPEPKLVVAPALAPALKGGGGAPGVIEMDFGGIKGADGGGGAVFRFDGGPARLKVAPLGKPVKPVAPAKPEPAPKPEE